MDTVIQVKCIDQTLIITNSPVIASGGLNENKLECDFCEKWDGFTKTAIFYQDKNNVYYSLLDEDDTCTIPKEATINEGTMFFGIFGTKGDVTRTSEVLRYKIVDGAITEDIKPSDPTPDIYEQIVTRLSRIESETIPNSIATHNTSSVAHKDIREVIPSQASSTNQLADKEFVNSSIATNTAYFKGTFNIVDDLGLTRDATHEQVATAIASKVTGATNNDYTFVAIPNATVTTQIDQYDRYKYNGTSWVFEFTLNNSSFTAEQWSAINSGITSTLVQQIHNIEVEQNFTPTSSHAQSGTAVNEAISNISELKSDGSFNNQYISYSKVIIFPSVSYELIEPTHDMTKYLKELAKWICANYPNKDDYIYIGKVAPGGKGTCFIHIYNTNAVDTDGYPQYASGLFLGVDNIGLTFNFFDYIYRYAYMVSSIETRTIKVLTQTEYDAMTTYSDTTLYVIEG